MQTECIFGIKPFQLLQRCNLLLELVRDLVVLQKDLDNITGHTIGTCNIHQIALYYQIATDSDDK